MSFWEVLVYGFLATAFLIVVAYLSSRVASIGYFRTREEYDRSIFNRHFGNNKGNGDEDGERQ